MHLGSSWFYEKAFGEDYPKIMKITLRKRGSTRWVITISVQKQQWTMHGRSSNSCRYGKWPRHRPKKVILEAQKRAEKSQSCHADGHLSSQKCLVRTEVSKVQRPGCTPKWHIERRFWRLLKQNMLTPTTKSQTCWPKILSFVISGITFSCVSQHESYDVFPAAISVQLKTHKQCRRGWCSKETRRTCGGDIEANEFGIKEWIGIRVYQTARVNYGIQSWNSDPSSIEKSIARDVNENAASSSEVWHQKWKTLVQASRNEWITKTQNRLKETRLTHHILEISNHPTLCGTSSRMYSKNWVIQKKARCWISRSTWWSGDYSCQRQRRQQRISGWITNKNLVITKRTDFEELKTLFDIAQKLIQEQKHEIKRGLNDRMACFSSQKICCASWTEKSSCQKQEYAFTQIPCFVLERCFHTLQLWWSGKSNLNISWAQRIMNNYLASMESHLSSRGIFPLGTVQWNFSKRFREKWQHAESEQKNSKIGSSTCRCSRTSIGRRVKQIPMDVFPNSVKG